MPTLQGTIRSLAATLTTPRSPVVTLSSGHREIGTAALPSTGTGDPPLPGAELALAAPVATSSRNPGRVRRPDDRELLREAVEMQRKAQLELPQEVRMVGEAAKDIPEEFLMEAMQELSLPSRTMRV